MENIYMNFNLNTGYGQISQSVPFQPIGKVFAVGDSSTVNIDILKQLFIPDPAGTVRFCTTLAAAMSLATADANDVIYLMPGHTEAVATTGVVLLNKAGVRVIGLGSGTLTPVFDITSTSGKCQVYGRDITLQNVRIRPGAGSSGCAIGLELVATGTAAGNNLTLDGVIWGPRSSQGAAFDTLMAVSTGSTGANYFDGLTIKNNVFQYWTTSVTGSGVGFNFVSNAANNVQFLNNSGSLYSSAAGAIWQSSGTNYGWLFKGNNISNLSTANVTQLDFNGSLTYGMLVDTNVYSGSTATAVGNFDLSYMVAYNSFYANAQNEDRKALQTPATPVS